jgi:Big-like domain-containing protein
MRSLRSAIVLPALIAAGVGCGRSSNPAAPTNLPATPAAGIVQAVNISGGSVSGPLPVGASVQLKATAQMADGSLADVSALATWLSDNSSVAAVSGSGLVTADRAGTANITASYQGTSGLFPMTVKEANTATPIAGAPSTQPAPGSGSPGGGTSPTPPGGGSSPNPSPAPPGQSCTNPLPITPPSPLPPCPNLPLPHAIR